MILEKNTQLFEYIQSFSFPGVGLIADGPIFFLPLFLGGMWLYYTFYTSKSSGDEKRRDLMHIFYACIVGIVLSYIVKQFIDIERPDAYLQQTGNLVMSHLPEKSFPSDHATVSLAFTVSLLYTGYKKVFWCFLPFVLMMNLSRIVVGVHWPLDILAGTILGTTSSIVFFMYLRQLKLVKKLDVLIIQIMKYIRLY